MNISTLPSNELRALVLTIGNELKSREIQELIKAREDITDIARRLGMSLHELMSGAINGVSSTGRQLGPVPAKYRNPMNEAQTWSGRGRPPQWVKDWLETGELTDLEIKA